MNNTDKEILNNEGLLLNGNDLNSPYDFNTWSRIYKNVSLQDDLDYYNQYLISWFDRRKQDKNERVTQIKKRFLRFLKEIQAFFSRQEALQWYNTIDIDNERHVAVAIPFFAKKLREISEYYRNKRIDVKRSKIKHNLTGTTKYIEKVIKQGLIDLLDKKPFNISFNVDSTVWQALSSFNIDDIKNTIQVEIKELYDDTDYFNEDGVIDSDSVLFQEVSSKGFTINDTWLLEATFEIDNLLKEVYSPNDTQLLYDVARNVLPFEVTPVTITVGTTQPTTKDFTVPLLSGKTFFYWPNSVFETDNREQFEPVSLSSGIFLGGTSNADYKLADTIFLNDNGSVSAAWLSFTQYVTADKVMKASINGPEVTFKYPYPGFGLSADDVVWTGREYETTKGFAFMSAAKKQATQLAYWDYTDGVLSCADVPISKSSLLNFAVPGSSYFTADKIRKHDYLPLITDTALSGDYNEAWLYKFTETQIPISVLYANLIVWPYGSALLSGVDIPMLNEYICETTHISSVQSSYFITGSSYDQADIIYKIQDFKNPIDTVIEAAWLSGESVIDSDVEYVKQKSFNFVVDAGGYSLFIWPGPDKNIEEIFKHIKHHINCPFSQKNLTYIDSLSCNCGAVNFSPFGHHGENFDEYNRKADFVMLVDSLDPKFDLSIWKGEDNKNYRESKDFTWFTTASSTSSLDWNGEWTNKITLSTGKCYCYYRANHDGTEVNVEHSMPFLRCNRVLDSNIKTKWIGLTVDENGEWNKSTDQESEMQLTPGNGFLVLRRDAINFNAISSTVVDREILSSVNSVWSNDYVTVTENTPIIVSFPTVLDFVPPEQKPPFQIINVLDAYWSVSAFNTSKEHLYTETFDNTQLITFLPKQEGTFSVVVTAEVLSSKEEEYEIGETTNTVISNVPLTVYTNTVSLSLNIKLYEHNVVTSTETITISSIQAIPEVNIDQIDIFKYTISGNEWLFYLQETTLNSGILKGYGNSIVESGAYKILSTTGNNQVYTPISAVEVTTTEKTYGTRTVDITSTYTFEGIPEITAVPLAVVENVQVPRSYSTCGFVWNQQLTGWNYNTNTKDITAAGAKPFWAKSENNNNIFNGGVSQLTFDIEMNLLKQPAFSDIVLRYEDFISIINTNNKSYVWNEPVKQLSTVNEVKWSKLLVDSVYSEEYDTQTTNITALSDTSDIVFRTYTSDSPQKVYYFANDDTQATFTLTAVDLLPSETSTGVVVDPNPLVPAAPYKNIFSKQKLKILTYSNINNLYEKKNGYIVDSLTNPIAYICPVHTTVFKTENAGINKFVSLTNVFGDSIYSGYNLDTESFYWLKETPETQEATGNINSLVYKKYQPFIPYRSKNTSVQQLHSPWLNRKSNTTWSDRNFIFTNNRGLVDTDIWKSNQLLSIKEYKVLNQTDDIYGNKYILCLENDQTHASLSSVWVQSEDGITSIASKKLSSFYSNINALVKDVSNTKIIGKQFGCFIDTLFTCLTNVQTNTINIVFNKFTYDYSSTEIYTSVTDTFVYDSSSSIAEYNYNYFTDSEQITGTYILSNEWASVANNSKLYFAVYSNYSVEDKKMFTLLVYDTFYNTLRTIEHPIKALIEDEALTGNISLDITNITPKKIFLSQDKKLKYIHVYLQLNNQILLFVVNNNDPFEVRAIHLIDSFESDTFSINYKNLNVSISAVEDVVIDVFNSETGFIVLGSNLNEEDITIQSVDDNLNYTDNKLYINKELITSNSNNIFNIIIKSKQGNIYQAITVNVV